MSDRLIIALDISDYSDLQRVAIAVAPWCGLFKIGPVAMMAFGPTILRELPNPVMLDLKWHDTPETVSGAIKESLRYKPRMITVHAAGGRRMIEAARDATGKFEDRPLLLAVTVLTSLDNADLEDLEIKGLGSQVSLVESHSSRLTRIAITAGADGVICSPEEVLKRRRQAGPTSLLVVPGVRLSGNDSDDHRRTGTPSQAIMAGADYVVVGRPITMAPDPAMAAQAISEEIRSCGA